MWRSKKYIYLNALACYTSILFSFLPLSSQVPVMLLFWVTPVRSLETILAQPLWRNSSVNSIDPPGDHQIHLHRYQLSQTIYKARQDQNFPASKNPCLILTASSLLYSSCEVTVIFGPELWFLGWHQCNWVYYTLMYNCLENWCQRGSQSVLF